MDNLLDEIVELMIRDDSRIIIGVSGHGASGKTTFANRLVQRLGEEHVNYMNTDPYIIPSSKMRKYAVIHYKYKDENHCYKMTACHPDAHHLSTLERDIRMIRDGLDLYTLDTDYMKRALISSQKKMTIIEGMSVAFTDPTSFDVNVYFYTDGETELLRRSSRDVIERGTSVEYLQQSHDERRIQYELFMHPYHQNFDIVIRNTNEAYFIEKADLD